MSLRTVILSAVAIFAVFVVARLYLSGHQVPEGQPPLGDLNTVSLDSLKRDFNRNSDRIRIILLLSPT